MLRTDDARGLARRRELGAVLLRGLLVRASALLRDPRRGGLRRAASRADGSGASSGEVAAPALLAEAWAARALSRASRDSAFSDGIDDVDESLTF